MNKSYLRLYFIYGTDNGDVQRSLDIIEQALQSGITLFQLREKGDGALAGKELKDFALTVQKMAARYDVPFIINDDVELAVAVQADGIHIGQDDMRPETLPDYFDDKIVGLSVRDESELAASNLGNVNYIGTGPVFPTLSKDDAGDATGVSGLKSMRDKIGTLPMVAIGGITESNYHECIENGADGIAVISAISEADDISRTVHKFLE
ncbi:MAG TPA: thiamine phosphate synthase [Candidatus Salinicoccus merdavium]|nr:thiamine phosphate synthase [Candidatus Salinicoccus merdavium]